jgi:DNA-binding transcriptional regulator YdaS (Cro superfamily)
MQETSALDRAIQKAGSQEALAELIGVKQQNVSYWRKSRFGVPGPYCAAIEDKTGISRHELRADIFGEAPAREGQAA